MRIPTLLLRQLMRLVLLLACVSSLTFVLMSNSPIDPVQAYIGADMLRVGEEQRAAIAEHWGLNEPPVQRFFTWLSAIVRGDFGTSIIYRQPVVEVIQEKFMSSISLLMIAWLLSGFIGFAAGVAAAMKRGTWLDRIIQWYCYALSSTPTFWAGVLLLLLFTVWLPIFPVGLGTPIGVRADEVSWLDRAYHMILPAITLSLVGVSHIALHTREKLIEVLSSEYITFARAKGLSGLQLVWRHGLRNILLPAITLQFASFSELFGGAVLIEQVFSYPGLGQATVEASTRGDVPLLMGIVLFSTCFVFVGNSIAEWTYRIIDPRIKEWYKHEA
ncbi:ABC transporter permease [Paenibacillus camelliae]|uniref:ABC transporter permease n=1 Tax=Paenibacillus camelliae TaxID=512410 RepID=UPI00203F960E|nr:ABC transporter permease [Paenibacillus camelliae]MCM3631798.1 ABC transporter permease [Paenibacillus camelliae]